MKREPVFIFLILLAFFIGAVHKNGSIETSRPKQGGIQNFGSIGCRHQNDAHFRIETVHLDKELI